MKKIKNKIYVDYYRNNSSANWPLSEKEFWSKMSEDMDFYTKWNLPKDTITPTPKNKVKEFLTKLIKL